MSKSRIIYSIGILLAVILVFGDVALARAGTRLAKPAPMTTAFGYQGQLQYEGAPVDANCDMAFSLYDAEAGGSQVGSTIEASVPVVDGIFAVQLDFGSSPFSQEARWLGIEVQCPGDSVPVALGRPALTARNQIHHSCPPMF